MSKEDIQKILERSFNDRVFTVEEEVVWVSGMNSHCKTLARSMAEELTYRHDVPTSLVYDDNAILFGGVQFNWGDAA